jgi:hypothetical protein
MKCAKILGHEKGFGFRVPTERCLTGLSGGFRGAEGSLAIFEIVTDTTHRVFPDRSLKTNQLALALPIERQA